MLLLVNVVEIRNRRKRRKRLGLSQHQVALQAGLTGNALHCIESGKSQRINHLRAREIARVLGCNVEDICSVPEHSA